MKGLICLWGLIRGDINSVVENYKLMFPNYKLDFLISTWEDQMIDENLFFKVLRFPSPTDQYLDQIKFPYTKQLAADPKVQKFRVGIYSLFFHNFKIGEFLKEINGQYDMLAKARTDLIFHTNHEFDFSQDICYIPENRYCGGGFVNDHFVCGKFDYVKKALKMDVFDDFFEVLENSFNSEVANLKMIVDNGCKIVQFPFYYYINLPDRRSM